MSYQAVSDRIIIIPEKADDKIDGILVPDPSKGKPKRGVVLSVGPLCREVKPGYEVMILEGHGALFHEDGVDKIVLKESDVLCYRSDQREIVFFRGEHVLIHLLDSTTLVSGCDPQSFRGPVDDIFNIIAKELKSNPSTLIGKFK